MDTSFITLEVKEFEPNEAEAVDRADLEAVIEEARRRARRRRLRYLAAAIALSLVGCGLYLGVINGQRAPSSGPGSPTMNPAPLESADGLKLYFTDGVRLVETSATTDSKDEQAVEKTLRELFAGPSEDQRADGIRGPIRGRAQLLDMEIRGDTATVDVSPRFEVRSGLSAELVPLQALTYTLTQFDSIDRVRLLIDGKRRRFFGTHGLEIDKPMKRSGGVVIRKAGVSGSSLASLRSQSEGDRAKADGDQRELNPAEPDA